MLDKRCGQLPLLSSINIYFTDKEICPFFQHLKNRKVMYGAIFQVLINVMTYLKVLYTSSSSTIVSTIPVHCLPSAAKMPLILFSVPYLLFI